MKLRLPWAGHGFAGPDEILSTNGPRAPHPDVTRTAKRHSAVEPSLPHLPSRFVYRLSRLPSAVAATHDNGNADRSGMGVHYPTSASVACGDEYLFGLDTGGRRCRREGLLVPLRSI